MTDIPSTDDAIDPALVETALNVWDSACEAPGGDSAEIVMAAVIAAVAPALRAEGRAEWERSVMKRFISDIPAGKGAPDPADYIQLLAASMLSARAAAPAPTTEAS